MKKSILIMSAAMAALVPTMSLADALPKNAVPLTTAEARALYSGKSTNWSKSRAYFAPDNTALMYGKDKTWYGEGKWTVDGNKVCNK